MLDHFPALTAGTPQIGRVEGVSWSLDPWFMGISASFSSSQRPSCPPDWTIPAHIVAMIRVHPSVPKMDLRQPKFGTAESILSQETNGGLDTSWALCWVFNVIRRRY